MKMCQIRASMFHRCYSPKSDEKGKKVGGDDSCNEDIEIARQTDADRNMEKITAHRLNFPRFVVLELFRLRANRPRWRHRQFLANFFFLDTCGLVNLINFT